MVTRDLNPKIAKKRVLKNAKETMTKLSYAQEYLAVFTDELKDCSQMN